MISMSPVDKALNIPISAVDNAIERSLKFKEKLDADIIRFLLNANPLTPTLRALIYRGSLAVMPYDEKTFKALSDRLFPSIQYIFLMSKAIKFFSTWYEYYLRAVSCIEKIPRTEIALGYAKISEALIIRDKEIAYKMMIDGIESLPISSPSLRAGIATKLASVIVELKTNYKSNINKIVDELLEADDISAISKVFSLVKIAILISDIDKDLSKKVLYEAAMQLEFVSIFRLFEAENILSRGFVYIFIDDFGGLIKLFNKLPKRAIKSWRYAILRIINESDPTKAKEFLEELKKNNPQEYEFVRKRILARMELKKKVEELLRNINIG